MKTMSKVIQRLLPTFRSVLVVSVSARTKLKSPTESEEGGVDRTNLDWS